jgi:CheY-like chemotaxis protein/two-component sensor histidine kinase
VADPDLQCAIQVIDRQVNQMSRLVDDLLDVSRITQGKIQLRKARLDLRGVVERAVEASRPLIVARAQNLSIAVPPEPLWVEGDAARLEQVISNLLNNAAKFTGPGGEIRLSLASSSHQARITVADTGMGITAEMLPKIFEPFVQADAGLERAESGLGIGLALVKSLVELHGGAVTAHSAGLGQGSELTVSLPLLEPPAGSLELESAESASPPGASELHPSRRILVVDDNQDAADSLAALLSLLGQDVRAVHDGRRALEAALTFRPEIVLLDIGMPGMDGYEVARRLRAQLGVESARLIALTGYGQAEDVQRSREAGFDEHLVKPVSLDLLKQRLCPAVA